MSLKPAYSHSNLSAISDTRGRSVSLATPRPDLDTVFAAPVRHSWRRTKTESDSLCSIDELSFGSTSEASSEASDSTDGSFHTAMFTTNDVAFEPRAFKTQKSLRSGILRPKAEFLRAVRFLESFQKTPAPTDVTSGQALLTWPAYCMAKAIQRVRKPMYPSSEISKRVYLWQGDITNLKVQALVNSTNQRLSPQGGVDLAIEQGAGIALTKLRIALCPLHIAEAKLTHAFKLPAKYLIHTVPDFDDMEALQQCYWNCLELAKRNRIRSVAFPCLSTGGQRQPTASTAMVALRTVRLWLSKHIDLEMHIVFVVYREKQRLAYEALMGQYFPIE